MNPVVKMSLEGAGIAESMKPIMPRHDVGRIMGITGERVRQIENLALGKLAQRMRELTNYETDENSSK